MSGVAVDSYAFVLRQKNPAKEMLEEKCRAVGWEHLSSIFLIEN